MTAAKSQYTRVSAYGLVTDSNSRILLGRLSKAIPRWTGYWTLPGGGLNFGEDAKDAVVREVEEETGMIVAPKQVATVNCIYDCSQEKDFHGIRILYHTELLGGELRPELAGTTDHCQWWTQQELEHLKLVDITQLAVKIVFEGATL